MLRGARLPRGVSGLSTPAPKLDSPGGLRGIPGPVGAPGSGRSDGELGARAVDRKAQEEGGPLPLLRLEGELAAVLLDHDRTGDREPLPGPLPDLLRGEERLEDAVADRGRDAGAGVTDRHDRLVAVARGAD